MFRLDRFLTLYCFQPLIRIKGNREPFIPILMYHSISELPFRSRSPYYEIRTSPSVFQAQMQYLHDTGFTTLFPSEIIPWLNSPNSSSKRAVCLTFDDAYENFMTAAFPVLQEFRFKSTVYVPTGLVGSTGPNGIKLLGWNQIRELSQMGVNFGSHTVSHPEMKKLTEEQLNFELIESKKSLEDSLGKAVPDFSHPFAFPEKDAAYIKSYRRLIDKSNYVTCMTTIIGSVKRSEDPKMMPRLPANDFDDLLLLSAKLNSSYNWLHRFQLSLKAFRQWT